MVSYVPQVREERMVKICLYVRIYVYMWFCHQIVGALSMAVVVLQPLECYYT